MNLVLISTEFPPGPGGIGTHAYQLAHHLTRSGWQVNVLSPQDYASDVDISNFNKAQPYQVLRQRRRRGLVCWVAARYLTTWYWTRRLQPDVLIASGERAVWLTAQLAPLARRPWLAVGHGSEFLLRRPWERLLTRHAFIRATAVVVVSRYTKTLMLSAGIHPRFVEVIHNGADANTFHPGLDVSPLRQRWQLPAGPILLTVGSVTERKAQDLVIRALPKLIVEFPSLTYLIAGPPILQAKLMDLAQALGVASHVRFLGVVSSNDLPYLYNLCDVYVLVSRRDSSGDVEGYGITVIEAALCGKAAVVTRDCGLEEAVRHGETGLAVKQESPTEISKALGHLLRDRELKKRMEKAARDKAITDGTWSIRVAKYDRLLRSLITSPRV